SWKPSQGARAYAVYQVPKSGKDCHGTDARNLVAVVTSPSFTAAPDATYAVTAVDRLGHESKTTKVKTPAP
ncbi:glycosyl hydrolase, partial [Nonomuraea angiospora]|nr:glycosyl hydrolase [Nonomuraea angiospora]